MVLFFIIVCFFTFALVSIAVLTSYAKIRVSASPYPSLLYGCDPLSFQKHNVYQEEEDIASDFLNVLEYDGAVRSKTSVKPVRAEAKIIF